MKRYFIIIPILLLVYFLTLDFNNNQKEIKEDKIKNVIEEENFKEKLVDVFYGGENKNMSIDDYIIGVLACEMPASFNMEALKAGAVVARTFYMFKTNTIPLYVASNNDQCFISENDMHEKWKDNFQKYYDIVKEAVLSTSGEFITYDGEVIQSFYFSMSNGYTEDVENVFSESKPYLVSVDSSWEMNLKNYKGDVTFSLEEFKNKLGINDNIVIGEILKTKSGRVDSIDISGKLFKGTEVRKLFDLRSTDFDIKISEETVNITTRGYGHGVGLSQYGANEMAKLGYNYQDIIKHYYKDVEILTL